VQTRKKGVGGEISMMRMRVSNGIGAIEVGIRAVSESTVVVVGHEGRRCCVVPFIGHDLDNVVLGDV